MWDHLLSPDIICKIHTQINDVPPLSLEDSSIFSTKPVKKTSIVKKMAVKPKKLLDKEKSKIALSIGPLFNLKQSDEEEKNLESNPSKNFEKLRKQKHRF